MIPEQEEFFSRISHLAIPQRKCKPFLRRPDWPGNSPELSPIENLRATIKRKLSKYDCSTKTSLIEAIIRIGYHNEELKKMCCNLVHSMPKRVSMAIKSKEGHIKY